MRPAAQVMGLQHEKGKWSIGDMYLKRQDLIEEIPRVVCLSSSWVDGPSSGSSEFDELSRVLWAQMLFPLCTVVCTMNARRLGS